MISLANTHSLLGFGIEGLYAQRGVASSSTPDSRKLDYIDVPAYLRVNLPTPGLSPYAYAGPQVSFELHCSDSCPSGRPKTTTAAVIGAGVRLGAQSAFSLEGRYLYGLSDLKLNTVTSSQSYKTRSFLILAGIDSAPNSRRMVRGRPLRGPAPIRTLGARSCARIEDSPPGVAAARSAGMRVIAVLTTHRAGDLMLADARLHALDRLRATPTREPEGILLAWRPRARTAGIMSAVTTPATRRPRLLQAALNGARRREDHPGLPTTSLELANAAVQSVAAGAAAIHVHVRDMAGAETLAPVDVARALTALRAAIPGIPVGVSTGAWIMPDTELRHRTVSAWALQPDYASVNFDEPGADRLATLLLSRGTGIEAGLAKPVAAERLVRSGLAPRCVRVLIEPQAQELDVALRTVAEIEGLLDAAAVTLPRLLHGIDRTAWPLITEAAARGYDTRIGFEDTLTLPDGSLAASNAVLVALARRSFD